VAPPRWRCERCLAAGREHLACSRRCLERHWRRRHRQSEDESIGRRARLAQASHNEGGASNWASFTPHRDRITGLLRAVQRAEGLCVLGAGNGDDLDLPALVREFGEVHLVDLDGAALARAHARVPAPLAGRVILHRNVDLTGLLDSVERWGEDDQLLAHQAERAAAAVAARLGRTFDVVLSSCVLSQLCTPFTRALARKAPEWKALMTVVGRTHLELVARLTRSGGSGIVLGDSYYGPAGSAPPPAPTWETLDAGARRALRDGIMRLRDPDFLAELVAGPPVRALMSSARLSEPWLWQVERAIMLVYALIFERS
jgi:hypothetical protein